MGRVHSGGVLPDEGSDELGRRSAVGRRLLTERGSGDGADVLEVKAVSEREGEFRQCLLVVIDLYKAIAVPKHHVDFRRLPQVVLLRVKTLKCSTPARLAQLTDTTLSLAPQALLTLCYV